MRTSLRRGAGAGAAGGAVSALVLLVLGERSIRDAIALEEAARRGAGQVPESALVSRAWQVVGGGVAAVLYGVLIGVVFAVVFTAVRHRSRLAGDFGRSVGLAAVGFATTALVPALKYPPNPPGVGDPATVGQRTIAYLTLVGAAICLAYLAWRASLALRERGTPDHVRVTLVGLGLVAAVALAYVLWPSDTDPVRAPATLVWRFRVVSLAGMAGMWSAMAVVHGWLCERAAARDLRRAGVGRAAS